MFYTKNKKKNVQVRISTILIVLGAIVASFFLGRRNREVKQVEVVKTITDTIKQTIKVDSLVYVTNTLHIPAKVDTNAVIQDYFTRKHISFSDTINEVKIKFTGNLFQNDLSDIKLDVTNYRPTQILREKKNGIWGGVSVGSNVIAPSVGVQVDKHLFGLSYNLISENRIIIDYKYRLWQN